MNRTTGETVTGVEHLRQSIVDVLTTPLGTRIERRTYGSLVPDLIDQPDNQTTRLRLYAAVASALMRWEHGCASHALQWSAAQVQARPPSRFTANTCRQASPLPACRPH